MKISPNDPCPCYSGLKYKKCCRPWHGGTAAPTPEALMRSRYSAYALGKVDYIMATTHPDNPQFRADRAVWRAQIQQFSDRTRFVGLQILAAEGDIVTFHAILFEDESDISYTERSLFKQKDGRWLYVDAVQA